MKFGTLLELNSNIEWWNYYVDYDALKKLFPSTPLDPSYLSTQQHAEATSILPTSRREGHATPEQFRAALDKERQKVAKFYRSKFDDLQQSYKLLLHETAALEERDLLGDDVIKEEDEEEDEDDVDDEGHHHPHHHHHHHHADESEGLLPPPSPSASMTPGRPVRHRPSIISRWTPAWSRRRSVIGNNPHEADFLEAQLSPGTKRARSRSANRGGTHRSVTSSHTEDAGADYFSVPTHGGTVPPPKKARRSSDFDSSENEGGAHLVGSTTLERRTSVSSASSHEHDRDFLSFGRRRLVGGLGLMIMDSAYVPTWAHEDDEVDEEQGDNGEGGTNTRRPAPVYVWMGSSDHATVMRIGFKKRISAVWLEAYSLKQYVELNLTAFEKILKKYDKNTASKLKKDYIQNVVLKSNPWVREDREALDHLLSKLLFLYRRVVTGGDEDIAKEQLRSQLREKIVVDRETVWSEMVSGRRGEGIFRSVEQDTAETFTPDGGFIRTPLGRIGLPSWWTAKGLILMAALGVLVTICLVQPFDRVEESNCLAMLVFCTILWATEAIPLFVTSLAVPLLTVVLRVLRSSDEADVRLSASDATKYIFSQMFSPTIMLLIGGFTIAAVLSKTRLDVMTASRILNAAGTKPSVVLLVLMCVATFASMWISNVAAPTLCYALIKPITDELHPKSVFSKCLVIAIALASNIGGQASPISSPQNLIALLAMDPPLSWLEWFAVSLPVASISILAIWAFLHVNYRWEPDLMIPRMRKNTDSLSRTHYFVLFVSLVTIALWCVEKNLEWALGDMGIIAVIPLLAFFGTGILSKEDFHSFHWSIVFLAMGGIALGKATLSSGLLDDLDHVLEHLVEGLGLYSILIVFSFLALIIATFISHTIAAVLLVPIATRIGESLDEPHPRLLIMATALICSAGMGLPVSGFPNMTAITQENKLGQRFIGATDFLKNGIPASVLATFVICSIGYAIMRPLGL